MNIKELATPLDITDIKFRVKTNYDNTVIILPYKNSRVDMNRLDEVVGCENWQRDHKEVNGVIYAGVGIKIKGEFVWKWDAGSKSNSEAEKGQASDSFKRACTNWGIGRELYNYPTIRVTALPHEMNNRSGKPKPKNSFMDGWRWFLQVIGGQVTMLQAIDEKGNKRFEYGSYNSKIVCWTIVRELWDEISEIKSSIAEEDYVRCFSIWNEFTVEEQEGLWLAPSKGGVFTTEERAILQNRTKYLGE